MSALARGGALLGLWVVLIGTTPVDIAAGVIPAAVAARVSLRLLPPPARRLRAASLPGLLRRFLCQSVMASIDVAGRALAPRLVLRPGFVVYPTRFAPGLARDAFAAFSSLMPGTLPVGDVGSAMLFHCLDVAQPVARQLADDEAALAQALRGSP